MEKKNNQSRIISLIFLSILLAVGVIASCHHKNSIEVEDNKDTVAAKDFAPLVDSGKLSIDLKGITSVAFPKYKLSKATSRLRWQHNTILVGRLTTLLSLTNAKIRREECIRSALVKAVNRSLSPI